MIAAKCCHDFGCKAISTSSSAELSLMGFRAEPNEGQHGERQQARLIWASGPCRLFAVAEGWITPFFAERAAEELTEGLGLPT